MGLYKLYMTYHNFSERPSQFDSAPTILYARTQYSLLAGECCYFPLECQLRGRRGQHERVHVHAALNTCSPRVYE